MSSNQNLHSMNKLTEFARDFEEEPETLFGRFVNKIQNAYNQSYNTVNDLSSVNPQSPTSSTTNTKSVFYADVNIPPVGSSSTLTRDSSSSSINSNTINQSTTSTLANKVNSETSSDTTNDSNSTEKNDLTSSLPMEGQEGRTMVNVLKRIRTMMASKNNVSIGKLCELLFI